jgi:hypothetical protein
MKRALEISKQRDLLKQEINVLIENTLPARILQAAGSLIQRLTRRPNLPPWYVSTILLGVIAILPQLIITWILKDPEQIIGNELLWSISTETMILVIPVVYFLLKYILTTIRDHIVDDIEENENLIKFQEFLSEIGKTPRAILVVAITCVIWSSVALPSLSTLISINLGVFLAVVVGNSALGLILFFMSWYMQFPSQLGNYQYKLYKLDPAKSKVINYISYILTVPFLVGALFQAMLILGLSFFKDQFKMASQITIIPLFIIWIPLVVHFINSQIAINKIITAAKWHMLNDIQGQIDQQYAKPKFQLTQNIDELNKLMDLYDRLYNTYNSKLVTTRILSLINQLLIPLLTFIITNYDFVLKLLKLKH